MIVNVHLKTVNNMENKQLILISSVTNEEMEQNLWLKEAMNKKLKDALVGPIVSINGMQEQQVRSQRMVDTFTHDGIKPQFLFQIPGQLIQFILPLDHLLVNIIFIPSKSGGLEVKVRINKLIIANSETLGAPEDNE
jgi:hypothetical protein